MATKFGKYTLLKRLAVGGMAEVFLGVATGAGGFKKHVAIKRILPDLSDEREFVSMFFDEARILARFNHPNIVQIFDLGRVKDTYFLAMEYVEGLSMDKVLKLCVRQGRRLPLEYAVKIVSDTCDALDYAHNFTGPDGEPMQVVHRDVSPQNVMVTYDGVVKVLDFGIAKAAGNLTKTHPSFLKGKVLFMSPEQIKQAEGLDHRSDIFSLGTMLYMLVTNKRPFKGKTELEIMMSIAGDEVPDPRSIDSSVPSKLCRVIERAMEKNRSRRYQSARTMRDELERFLFERQVLVDKHALADFLSELAPVRKTRSKQARGENLSRTPPPLPAPAGPDVLSREPAEEPEDDLLATVDERPRQDAPSSPGDAGKEEAPWEGDTAKRLAAIDTVRDGKPFDGVDSRRGTPVLVSALVVLVVIGGGFLAWQLLTSESGTATSHPANTEPQPLPRPARDPGTVDGGTSRQASTDPFRHPPQSLDAGTAPMQPPTDQANTSTPDESRADPLVPGVQPDPDPRSATPFRTPPRTRRRRKRHGDPKEVSRKTDTDETPDEKPHDPVPDPDVAQEVKPTTPDGGSPQPEAGTRVAENTGNPEPPDPVPTPPPQPWPPPGYRPVYQPPEVVTKRRIQGSEPAFPAIARQAGLEATILVKVYIDPEGKVGKYKFLKTDKYFEQAVVDAIQTWRFRPHTINGRAVGTYTVYKFVFEQD